MKRRVHILRHNVFYVRVNDTGYLSQEALRRPIPEAQPVPSEKVNRSEKLANRRALTS
jgi:hypothetical protein